MKSLNRFWKTVVGILSVLLVLFQMYTAGFGTLQDIQQRSVHLFFVLTICFILKPFQKKKPRDGMVPWYDIILIILSACCTLYVFVNYPRFIWNPLQWLSPLDMILAVIMVVLILEASRRAIGLTFPIMALILMAYAYFGEYIPGVLGHKQFSITYTLQQLYHTTNGIWGSMVGTSASMLAMFSIFGALLATTGGAETFLKIGLRYMGKYVGGSGKVAAVSSGLFGMVSGSPMSNVVATGTFTIPMMKESGYSKEWAGAISAVASTGGQIMPPMLGAGAFIMAQLLNINYIVIAKSAIIPAFLYYLSTFVAIHYYSKKMNIRGINEKPSIAVSDYIVILAPLSVFLYFIIRAYTVTKAAFYATIIGFVVCVVLYGINKKDVKECGKKTVSLSYDLCISGASGIVDLATLLAGSQICISIISMTGLGIKLSGIIVNLGSESLFLSLFLSMLVCILLGMGLPPAPAYVLSISVLSSALVTLGMDLMAAHLFVFFFASLGTITPPVCAAVYVSSGIAQSNWFKTGLLSCMIALPCMVIPYTFAYNPSLLLMGSWGNILISLITACIGVGMMALGVAGYIKRQVNMVVRVIFIISGIMLLVPSIQVSLIGMATGGVGYLLYRNMKPRALAAENEEVERI